MKNIRLLSILLLSSVLFVQAQRVTLTTATATPLTGASFDFQPPGAGSGCQQVCPLFYNNKDGPLTGTFKFEPYQIQELNATGSPCCLYGATCNPGPTTCDGRYVFGFFNFFNTNVTVPKSQVVYTANIPNTLSRPTQQCTQADVVAGTYQICVGIELTYTAFPAATLYRVLNRDIPIKQDSLLAKLKISNWKFGVGSTGFRLVLDLGVADVNLARSVLTPSGAIDSAPQTSGFDGIVLVDSMGRQGGMTLQTFTVYDGTTFGNVTVSGPYSLNANPSGRFFYFDVPRKDGSTVELYFNMYLPVLTGDTVAGGSYTLSAWFGMTFTLLLLLTYV